MCLFPNSFRQGAGVGICPDMHSCTPRPCFCLKESRITTGISLITQSYRRRGGGGATELSVCTINSSVGTIRYRSYIIMSFCSLLYKSCDWCWTYCSISTVRLITHLFCTCFTTRFSVAVLLFFAWSLVHASVWYIDHAFFCHLLVMYNGYFNIFLLLFDYTIVYRTIWHKRLKPPVTMLNTPTYLSFFLYFD